MTQVEKEPAPNVGGERHSFQAEVSKVLDIVINSLYSHREIFLRELISNAADALDKLRFRSTTEHELLGDQKELCVRLEVDPKNNTLTITDTGVGMSKDELIKNLGTIAHSGSRAFLEGLEQAKKEGRNGPELIGQFGVGFYSAFIVADQAVVVSRAAGSDEAWSWTSDARGEFTIAPVENAERGTTITLSLKDDAKEFADRWRISSLVKKYSDFVSFPIKMRKESDDEESESTEWETVNKANALWRRPKSEIKDEDYEEFYKHVTHDWEGPADTLHFSIEGTLSFVGLLFIPKRPPFDLYDREGKRGVRLYVKRVFIMDDCSEFLPEYLRFVRGVIDSDDLPLNVSRELLQADRITQSIQKTIVSKILGLLEKMATDKPEDYAEFWEHFGVVLKEGLHFDAKNRDRLAKLVRFASSREELTSLDGYIERMTNPESNDPIYYAYGQNREAVEGSPHIESLVSKGYEVLYMTDPIDEWALHGLEEYQGKKLVSAMKADLKLDEEQTEEEKQHDAEKAEDLKTLVSRAKDVLEKLVSEVRLSKRLTGSPCCLVVPEGGPHAHIERMLRAQGQEMPKTKRILELNPDHPVIERLNALNDKHPGSEDVRNWIRLLHDQALLAEGSPLEDPQGFARRMATLMEKAIDVGDTKED